MTICEHCGASVHGDVCEYCDMPVKTNAKPAHIVMPAPSETIYKKIKSAKSAKQKITEKTESTKQKITEKTEKHLNHIKALKAERASRPKLKLNKRGKKFLRLLFAGTISVVGISFMTMGLAINHNVTRTYVQSPLEYEPNVQQYIDHHHSYNYDYGYDYDYDYDYDYEYEYDDYGYELIEETVPAEEALPFFDEERPVYDTNEIFKENGVFPSGTYQIGVDIPEGTYIFIPELSDGHGVEGIYADPHCENQISSAYVHFDGTRIAEISGNGYLDFSWCTAYNLDMYPDIVNDPHKTDGMFIVGRDIPAGTYRVVGYNEYEGEAEWYVYSSINAVGAIIKDSGTLDNYDDYYDRYYGRITLNDGEYFELRNCIIGDLHS
ncbi:MAG: hypothetical protein K2J39_10995 [Ruminococcus sp.]|nr:hypothetical protein [Ruminococcus sp.]